MGRCDSCGMENAGDAEYCLRCGEHLGLSRRCHSCGVVNLPDAVNCRMCGAGLKDLGQAQRTTSTERPGYRPKFKTCHRCGRGYDNHLALCPHCTRMLPEDHYITRRSSPLPFIAGTSLFLAGILCLINGMLIGSYGWLFEEFAYCGFIEIVLGIISITGWIFCMRRSHLVYVIIVSILMVFSIGPLFISSLLGLFALILIAVSAKEFR
ncbi:MAG: zinc ribbon domain-containing protein [Thermoplasmata archaeon]|nr:zinc ribbon domain-containing protein [Thermoplasmata archaeon]